MKLINGDCLIEMQNIPDGSIDMILCDLPYGTTRNKWDVVIDFDLMWEQYERIIKDDGVIVLFATQPFTSSLIVSNLNLFRYCWVWDKMVHTGFLNANYKPLQKTEDIVVFSKSTVGSKSKNPIRYYPQDVNVVNKTKRNSPNSNWRKNKGHPSTGNKLNSDTKFNQKYSGYPSNILQGKRDKCELHETQKPVSLMEYLIKTYTNETQTVLDNTMGSGTTGVACKNTNRNFIGIEMDREYFEIAQKRINEEQMQPQLF